jgi:hypothetical protein
MHSTSFIAFLAALPATLACLAETSLPASTGSKSLSEPQYIASGETFDGEFVKVSFLNISFFLLMNLSTDIPHSTTAAPPAAAKAKAAKPTQSSSSKTARPCAT